MSGKRRILKREIEVNALAVVSSPLRRAKMKKVKVETKYGVAVHMH